MTDPLEALLVVEGGARLQERDEADPARVAPLVGLDGQDLPRTDNEPLPLPAERTAR